MSLYYQKLKVKLTLIDRYQRTILRTFTSTIKDKYMPTVASNKYVEHQHMLTELLIRTQPLILLQLIC